MIKALTIELAHHGFDTDTTQGYITVAWDRWDGERPQFNYEIRDVDNTVLASGSDLRLGCGHEADHVKAMETLLAFLEFAADSYRYSGMSKQVDTNTDLFPLEACEFAYMMGDDLNLARLELEESMGS